MAEATYPHCLTSFASKEFDRVRVAKCRKCGRKFRVYSDGLAPGKRSAPSEITWDDKLGVERELIRGEVAWLITAATMILLVAGVVIYEVFFV